METIQELAADCIRLALSNNPTITMILYSDHFGKDGLDFSAFAKECMKLGYEPIPFKRSIVKHLDLDMADDRIVLQKIS